MRYRARRHRPVFAVNINYIGGLERVWIKIPNTNDGECWPLKNLCFRDIMICVDLTPPWVGTAGRDFLSLLPDGVALKSTEHPRG